MSHIEHTTVSAHSAADAASLGLRRVVGVRPDGLGIRLQCMLETMHLAELLAVDFAVAWPDPKPGLEHHAIVPAADMFMPAFRQRHVIPRPARGLYAEITGPVEDIEALTALGAGSRGWMIRSPSVLKSLPEDMRRPALGGFRRMFEAIAFQPHLSEAIAAAARAPIPKDAVAVHLRAGDIVYGRHRFGGRFTRKVVCLPVARRLVQTLTTEGRTVVLFCQDPLTADLFRGGQGVVIGSDLTPTTHVVAQALFEIALMSRCAEIYAGDSVFAHVAALIGDGSVINPGTVFRRSKQATMIEQDLFGEDSAPAYPPLQRAFAAWSGAEMLRARAPERAMRLLETALKFDPENSCYVLRLASLQCSAGRADEAEALVERSFGDDPVGAKMRERAVDLLHKAGIGGKASILVADRGVLANAAAHRRGVLKALMDDAGRFEADLSRVA